MNTRDFKMSEQTASALELQAKFCELIDGYYDVLLELWGENVAQERMTGIEEHREALWDALVQLTGESVRENLAELSNNYSII